MHPVIMHEQMGDRLPDPEETRLYREQRAHGIDFLEVGFVDQEKSFDKEHHHIYDQQVLNHWRHIGKSGRSVLHIE